MISPAQCRAARALLTWSQDDLERVSGVAKRTIAEFERGSRGQLQEATETKIEKAFDDADIELIPQNGGGEGVRFVYARPRFVRLFRRDDVDHNRWIAFAFHYKDTRVIGFVKYEAMGIPESERGNPIALFDAHSDVILACAAEKFDRSEFDPAGRILIQVGDLKL